MSTVLTEDAAYALEARVALSKKIGLLHFLLLKGLSQAGDILSWHQYPLVSPICGVRIIDGGYVQLFIRKQTKTSYD